jgi:hypothetical protein
MQGNIRGHKPDSPITEPRFYEGMQVLRFLLAEFPFQVLCAAVVEERGNDGRRGRPTTRTHQSQLSLTPASSRWRIHS